MLFDFIALALRYFTIRTLCLAVSVTMHEAAITLSMYQFSGFRLLSHNCIEVRVRLSL